LHVAELRPQHALNQTLDLAQTASRNFHGSDFRQNKPALTIN
jgi:hypothetical protein